MANKEKFELAHVEAALRATGGIVSAAAKTLQQAYRSCTPASVRNYINRHASLRRVIDEVVEQNLDLAEHKLLKNIDAGKEASIFFYLKTKGKARGYVVRVEATGLDGGPIAVTGKISVETANNARRRNTELLDQVRERLAGGTAGATATLGVGEDPGTDEPG